MKCHTLITGIILIFISLLRLPSLAFGYVDGCEGNVAPSGLPPYTAGIKVTFTLRNTGSTPIREFHILDPFDEIGYTTERLNGWDSATYSDGIYYTGGTLPAGETLSITWNVSTGNTDGMQGAWAIDVTDDPVAGIQNNCTGNLYAFSNASIDITAPALTDVNVAVSSTTNIAVTWSTNEAATSKVMYGTAAGSYSATQENGELSTNHSVVIPNLTPGTTYYLAIASADAKGNQATSGEFSFTMPTPGTNTTVTVTETVTQTQVQTVNQVEKQTVTVLVRDQTPPTVSFSNKWEKYYSQAPLVTGVATDNTIVSALEYTIDGGKHWRPVDAVLRKANVSFSFSPPITEEGDYKIAVRAYDAEGNKGMSVIKTIVIDRLPPMIGAVHAAWGPGLNVPVYNDWVTTMVTLPLQLILGAAGGPTRMTTHTQQPLNYDDISNRWFGTFTFDTPGDHDLTVTAVDGFDRTTTTSIASVHVVPAATIVNRHGQPITAAITVWHRHPATGTFSVWEGQPFNRPNPVVANERGEFGLILPAGTYYLKAAHPDFSSKVSNIFTLPETGLVRADIVLSAKPHVQLGRFRLYLPSGWQPPFVADVISLTPQASAPFGEQLHQPLPEMEWLSEANVPIKPTDWLGQVTLMTIDTPWLPTVTDSITYLSQMGTTFPRLRTAWVANQNTATSLQGIRARAGDGISYMVADRDATLTEYFQTHRLPFTVLIDRVGIVRAVSHGTLPIETIQKIMEE